MVKLDFIRNWMLRHSVQIEDVCWNWIQNNYCRSGSDETYNVWIILTDERLVDNGKHKCLLIFFLPFDMKREEKKQVVYQSDWQHLYNPSR